MFVSLSRGFDGLRQPASQQTLRPCHRKTIVFHPIEKLDTESSQAARSLIRKIDVTYQEKIPCSHTHLQHIMEVAIRSTKRRRSPSDHEDRLAKKRKKEEEEEEEEEASIVTAMERIAHEDFPTELLWKIIGFSLRSPIGRCEISAHDEPPTLRTGGLIWPKTLSGNALRTIRNAVAYILPESVIVEMSADFGQALPGDHQPRLVIPRALQGREDRVRNLVLNLDLNLTLTLENHLAPRRLQRWRQLGRATAGIETVAESFPNLETCVLVVDIGHFDRQPRCRVPPLTFPRLGDIAGARGISLMDKFIDLVDAFGKRGPGKRRLLRFEGQERNTRQWSGDGRGRDMRSIWRIFFGPLVRVDALSERVVDDDTGHSEALYAMHMQEPDIGNEASPRSEAEYLRCLIPPIRAYRFKRQKRITEGPQLADRRHSLESE
jgi:hypothetical protein